MSERIEFLRAKAIDARELGHEHVQLVKYLRRPPKTWDRVRVVTGKPSLMGKCIGATGHAPGQYLFDVKLVELEAWLLRGGSNG